MVYLRYRKVRYIIRKLYMLQLSRDFYCFSVALANQMLLMCIPFTTQKENFRVFLKLFFLFPNLDLILKFTHMAWLGIFLFHLQLFLTPNARKDGRSRDSNPR